MCHLVSYFYARQITGLFESEAVKTDASESDTLSVTDFDRPNALSRFNISYPPFRGIMFLAYLSMHDGRDEF